MADDDDDARARALEENRRRSQVMAEAQRHGPPAPVHGCTTTDHAWAPGPGEWEGVRFLMCERCAATVPPPVVEPGEQLVPVDVPEEP